MRLCDAVTRNIKFLKVKNLSDKAVEGNLSKRDESSRPEEQKIYILL